MCLGKCTEVAGCAYVLQRSMYLMYLSICTSEAGCVRMYRNSWLCTEIAGCVQLYMYCGGPGLR